MAVVRSSGGCLAPVYVTCSSSIGGSGGICGKAPVSVAPVVVLQDRLQWLLSFAPVAVASGSSICRSQLQYLWLRWYLSLKAPVSGAGSSSICRSWGLVSCNVAVDIDDYQKRSPVESVLESTGVSHVIVSNQVRGNHSTRLIGCKCP